MKTMAEVIMLHWSASTHTESEPSFDKCDGCGAVLRVWGEDSDMPGQLAAHQAEALAAAGYGPVREATALIRDLTDPDDCSFDHHGGCQAHGYLDLEIGEMCPQLQAKAWAYNHPEVAS